MKAHFLRNLGLIYLMTGIILILLSAPIITGFAVSNGTKSLPSIPLIGIAFLITGMLFLTEGERQKHNLLETTLEKYEKGKINPVQTASVINSNSYRIQGVKYKEGLSLTVLGDDGSEHSINVQNDNKARELALAFYKISMINNPRNLAHCQLHIGKGASTKHHLAGFMKHLEVFENRYKEDLEGLAQAN